MLNPRTIGDLLLMVGCQAVWTINKVGSRSMSGISNAMYHIVRYDSIVANGAIDMIKDIESSGIKLWKDAMLNSQVSE